jgi:ADP-heptose:LPS heptosyltransferase
LRSPYDYVYCFENRDTYRRLVEGVGRESYLIDGDVSPDEPFPLHCLRLVNDGKDPGANEWLSLPVSDRGRSEVEARLERAAVNAATLVVGLHPSFYGARWARVRHTENVERKTWPIRCWAEFARRLHDWSLASGVPLFLLADLLPGDGRLGRALHNESGGIVRIYTEAPDFERYKATIERMDLLVTPDTGPMHIAAAVGTPIVALFSSETPMLVAPFTDPRDVTILRPGNGPKAQRGLEHIEPNRVLSAAVGHLTRGRTRPPGR